MIVLNFWIKNFDLFSKNINFLLKLYWFVLVNFNVMEEYLKLVVFLCFKCIFVFWFCNLRGVFV